MKIICGGNGLGVAKNPHFEIIVNDENHNVFNPEWADFNTKYPPLPCRDLNGREFKHMGEFDGEMTTKPIYKDLDGNWSDYSSEDTCEEKKFDYYLIYYEIVPPEKNQLFLMKQQLATRFRDQEHINLDELGIKREDILTITIYEGSAYLWYFDYPNKDI